MWEDTGRALLLLVSIYAMTLARIRNVNLRVISPGPGGTNEQENEDDDSAGTGLSSYQMYAYGIADLEIDQTSANTAQMLKPSLTKCKFNNLI